MNARVEYGVCLVKVVCAYCKAVISPGSVERSSRVSHGMCGNCFDDFINKWAGLSLDNYLEGFGRPVVVVTSEGRIVATNSQYTKRFDINGDDLTGVLTGDALGCKNARLPGGCGHTPNCSACTIRKAVIGTLIEKKSHPRERAYIGTDKGMNKMFISTELVGEAVAVIIEGLDGDPEPSR